jgi:hypothetical protein
LEVDGVQGLRFQVQGPWVAGRRAADVSGDTLAPAAAGGFFGAPVMEKNMGGKRAEIRAIFGLFDLLSLWRGCGCNFGAMDETGDLLALRVNDCADAQKFGGIARAAGNRSSRRQQSKQE